MEMKINKYLVNHGLWKEIAFFLDASG